MSGGLNFIKKLFQPKPAVKKVDIARRFELIGRVGQGSMSKVWRARDTLTGQIVALKVLDAVKTKRLESRFIGLKKPTEGEIARAAQASAHRPDARSRHHHRTTNSSS